MTRNLIAAAVIVAALALSGCADSAPEPVVTTPTHPPAADGDGRLMIGTLMDSADPAALVQVAGVELAIRDIHDAGGVLGEPVTVFHRTAHTGDEAVAALTELAALGVDAVVTPPGTEWAEQFRASAAEQGIAVVAAPESAAAGDEGFAARIRAMDPALTSASLEDAVAGSQSYDAVVVAALTAVQRGNDSGDAIGQAAADITGGPAVCGSFAECIHVLGERPDIGYQPGPARNG